MGVITVQLSPEDEDLVCTVETGVGEVPTVRWVKEALCKQDPTGEAAPADFRLRASTRPDSVLDDAVVVTAALGRLVLCSEGGGEPEQRVADPAGAVPVLAAEQQAPVVTTVLSPAAEPNASPPAASRPSAAGGHLDGASHTPVQIVQAISCEPLASPAETPGRAGQLQGREVLASAVETPSLESLARPAATRAKVWVVVGGADKGGVLVKTGQALDSEKAPTRLATGASVREDELVGERLRYTLVSGNGPSTGWVSTRIEGKVLLVPQQPWRLFAVSDLHVDFKENEEWVAGLPEAGHEHDAVILAGDISHRVDLVRWTIEEFSKRFAYVFYCTGNHELWVTRADAKVDGDREFRDSVEKFRYLLQVAREAGAMVDPTRLGTGADAIWVIPLQSWYESEFGNPGEALKQQAKKIMTDFRECVWPEGVGSSPDEVARFFDGLNKGAPEGGYDAPVVTFSHFLPRLELLPTTLPPDYRLLRAAVGTKNLEERVRSLGSKLHVFGHSHVNWYTHWQGVHYVQNALRYPKERKMAPGRIDVSFNAGNPDPMRPFLVWKSEDPSNFCLMPERCGRGCPRALASSVNFRNADASSAATTWEKSVEVADVEGLEVSDGVLEDLAEVKAHLLAAVDPKTGGDFVQSAWPLWVKHPLCHILVARTQTGKEKSWGPGIAGTVTLQKLNSEEGWVMGLRVRKAARREGVAKLLLREVDLRAGTLKGGPLRRLRLAVSSGNDAMTRLCDQLKLEVEGRFAFVECNKCPGPLQGPGLVRITTDESKEFALRVGGVLQSSGGLYQQTIGQFQAVTDTKMKTHERLGHLAGWRTGQGERLQGVVVLVPEHDGRNRVIAFAAAESDSALAMLLRCAWHFELKACEPASPIYGYLPITTCKPIERGEVPGWERPRSSEELVFGWVAGIFRRSAARK